MHAPLGAELVDEERVLRSLRRLEEGAGPPALTTRSTISVISRSGSTSAATRRSSPSRSRSAIHSRRSRGSADTAAQSRASSTHSSASSKVSARPSRHAGSTRAGAGCPKSRDVRPAPLGSARRRLLGAASSSRPVASQTAATPSSASSAIRGSACRRARRKHSPNAPRASLYSPLRRNTSPRLSSTDDKLCASSAGTCRAADSR